MRSLHTAGLFALLVVVFGNPVWGFNAVYNVPGDSVANLYGPEPFGQYGFPVINMDNHVQVTLSDASLADEVWRVGDYQSFFPEAVSELIVAAGGRIDSAGGSPVDASELDILPQGRVRVLTGGQVGSVSMDSRNSLALPIIRPSLLIEGGNVGNVSSLYYYDDRTGPPRAGDVNLSGGAVLSATVSNFYMTGGQVTNGLAVHHLDISGGSIGGSVRMDSGKIRGGHLAGSLEFGFMYNTWVVPGGIRNGEMTGGQVDGDLFVGYNAAFNLKGGQFNGDSVQLDLRSNLNVYGYGFEVNGVPIDGLAVSDVHTLSADAQHLSGFLADGSPFEFDLNDRHDYLIVYPDPIVVANNAPVRLFVTAPVPEPTACATVAIMLLACITSRRNAYLR